MKIIRHGLSRGLAALLAVCLAAGLAVNASGAGAEGAAGENGIFASDAFLVMEGIPTFYSGDFEYTVTNGNATIVKYSGSAGILAVPDQLDGHGVEKIGDEAFSGCRNLTGVTLPDGLTSIGDGAFARCGSLTGVTLPDGLISIGDGAFSHCGSLTSVTIPESVAVMGHSPFAACTALTRIDVAAPNPVYASIDGVLFEERHNMLVTYPAGRIDNAYAIPQGILYIGVEAFSGCRNLTGVTLPDGLISIGNYAFSTCQNLTGMTLPDSLTSIGDGVFFTCWNMTSITLPDGLTSIGNAAFYKCKGLTSVTLPDSLTSIGVDVFAECPNLTLTVAEGSRAAEYAGENGIPYTFGHD
ncbi:MAG: leucine-rich repeat domain-containing protein [Firmicutes bacterium]|nr:leucine-rich repeat domain-containing protein [Bacillota bacterium]